MSHTIHGVRELHKKTAIDRNTDGHHDQVAVATYISMPNIGASRVVILWQTGWLPKLKFMHAQ